MLNDFFADDLASHEPLQNFARGLKQLQTEHMTDLRLTPEEILLLNQHLDELHKADEASLLKAIALVFARCGAEVGKVKRLLDENEISWGFFTDHNPFEPHCNAHPNNLVVLDPLSNAHGNLLGVLDLDMAYSSETFINTIEPDPMFFTDEENREIQEKKYGTRDLGQFDDWLNSEKYEMEVALGGAENMDFNFGMERQSSVGG